MNSIRSPLAEAIARSILPRGVLVRSAGVRSGTRDPFVDAVVAERGLPVIATEPHELDEMEDGLFDIVVTLSDEANAHAREMARTDAHEVEHWAVSDPSLTEGRREMVLDAYRATADELEQRIRERFLPKG